MTLPTVLQHRNALFRLRATDLSHSSSDISSIAFVGYPPPALWTEMSIRLNRSSVSLTTPSTCLVSHTSAESASASLPMWCTSWAVELAEAESISTTTNSAPACANVKAIALPIPCPAPVTIATLPSIKNWFIIFFWTLWLSDDLYFIYPPVCQYQNNYYSDLPFLKVTTVGKKRQEVL